MEIRFDGVELRRPGFVLVADLTIASGGVTALIGPSGAGKSSLLDLVAGFEAPGVGRIEIGGTDVTALGPAARPVSMVFQDNNLFPHLTVAQNVGLGLDPALRLTAEQSAQRMRVLGEVGLSGYEDRLPGTLSGGQQSRAALARALVQDRAVLLLDEPFAALGPGLRKDMLALVSRVAGAHGLTVLMVTHDPQDALAIAGQTVLVAEGLAAPPQDTHALLDDPPDALRAYLGV